MRRVLTTLGVALIVTVSSPGLAGATFHLAEIDELMVSYDGDSAVQFVEIVMKAAGQQFVDGTKLSAFDADGNFTGVVLTVGGDVAGGNGRSWIMGTAAFEATSGLAPDFVFAPGLPTDAGMVCWGLPLQETDPADYVDCVSYGDYSGPANVHTASPSRVLPEGHSLQRIDDLNVSAADFVCADPAGPENNAGETASMPATTPCPSASTTTTSTTSTTLVGGSTCGDGTGDASVTASDALLALGASVGTSLCELCRCDVDASGGVAASDALRILNAAVGVPVSLVCPAC
jgi:hypothetical protein